MKILVINSGSSSIKYTLFEMDSNVVLTQGSIARIGEATSDVKHEVHTDGDIRVFKSQASISDHGDGLRKVVDLLTTGEGRCLDRLDEIDVVGHRVVHGGEVYRAATVVTQAVKDQVKALIPLAPLHNPANLMGIEFAEQVFKGAKQVAVFDTAFHQTMPDKAFRYPLPDELYQEHQIRAYGMHGTSHRYVSKQMQALLPKPVEETAFITIHLGNGCSMAAVKGGKCIDTSMGLSPLAGLMMGTRTGDIDPSIPFFLGTKLGLSFQEIDNLLNKQSGLKGIAGSNDMRDVLAKRSKGEPNAVLAIDMYTNRVKKYIGAYIAEMGSIDAIVFTAGIGENSAEIRGLVCEGLGVLGIDLDHERNHKRTSGNRSIHAAGGKVEVWVIPTNEELEIALQAQEVTTQ